MSCSVFASVFARYLPGIGSVSVLHLLSVCLVPAWYLPGIRLVSVRYPSGIYWYLPGIRLVSARYPFGICPVCPVSAWYLLGIRPVSVRDLSREGSTKMAKTKREEEGKRASDGQLIEI